MSLPTIDEFLAADDRPSNIYVDHPGFDDLYIRKSRIFVRIEGREGCWCHPVIQVANVTASSPGSGAFTSLVDFLLERDLAIYVENAHPRFGQKLLRMGFIPVNQCGGNCFLLNYENHLLGSGM
jgi:hypothetical protein